MSLDGWSYIHNDPKICVVLTEIVSSPCCSLCENQVLTPFFFLAYMMGPLINKEKYPVETK